MSGRSYIPAGAHQQGRLPTQTWLPRRVEPDFVDTYPTGPAPLEAAHGCYEPPDDRPIEDGGGVVVWLVLGVLALLVLALFLHAAAQAGML